ncbi:BQ2448_4345 [Microbotryum intermedium]|uniref:BQ2448_4345 protein n=1 Tax=Microbotryum intermedium TaxID=269621 RepID=A0A238FNM8_9BASI|nr:BQ2448_4345 [Microbotryum intermedium]
MTLTLYTSASNPLIPRSISTRCQTFLTQLNGDKTIAQCTMPLISTLNLFAPENGIATYTTTQSAITISLDKLCATDACSDNVIRAALTAFNGNCSAELQARQAVVLGEYDTLYILQPFRTSVCSRDVNGGYCLTDIAAGTVPPSPDMIVTNATNSLTSVNASASAAASTLAANSTPVATSAPVASLSKSYSIALVSPSELFVQFTVQARRFLRRRQTVASTTPVVATNTTSSAAASTTTPASTLESNSTGSTSSSFDLTGVLPNPTTWAAHSLPFLFLSTNMSSTLLCTSCTKSILAAYVSWEIRMPYALGLANSPMLGHQGDLWTGTGETCGTGFLASIQSLAGEINVTGGASSRDTSSHFILLSATVIIVVAAMI